MIYWFVKDFLILQFDSPLKLMTNLIILVNQLHFTRISLCKLMRSSRFQCPYLLRYVLHILLSFLSYMS